MARIADPSNPACPHCGQDHTVRNGSIKGRQRWVCATCHRSFGRTTGTPVYRLRTPLDEVARCLAAVARLGSLSAVERESGHKYETIGRWRRTAPSAAELHLQIQQALELSPAELDAFWRLLDKTPVKTAVAPVTKPESGVA